MHFVNYQSLAVFFNQYSGDMAQGGRDPILILIKSSQGTLFYLSSRETIDCSIATGIFEGLSFVRYIYGLYSKEEKIILLVLNYKNQEDKYLLIGKPSDDTKNRERLTAFTIIPSAFEGKDALSEYMIQNNYFGEPNYSFALLHSDHKKSYLKNKFRLLLGLVDLDFEMHEQEIAIALELDTSRNKTEEVDFNAKPDARGIT